MTSINLSSILMVCLSVGILLSVSASPATTRPQLHNPRYRPVVLWHGMGDFALSQGMLNITARLQATLPGIYVHSVQIGESEDGDRKAGYFDNLNRQVSRLLLDVFNR